MVTDLLWIIIGGGLGSACRYLFTLGANRWFGVGFPWGTLGVNLIGCFMIGCLFSLAGRNFLTPQLKLLLMTGFLGGLTTFSTFALENTLFCGNGAMLSFLTNFLLNNLGGIGFVLLGLWVGKFGVN